MHPVCSSNLTKIGSETRLSTWVLHNQESLCVQPWGLCCCWVPVALPRKAPAFRHYRRLGDAHGADRTRSPDPGHPSRYIDQPGDPDGNAGAIPCPVPRPPRRRHETRRDRRALLCQPRLGEGQRRLPLEQPAVFPARLARRHGKRPCGDHAQHVAGAAHRHGARLYLPHLATLVQPWTTAPRRCPQPGTSAGETAGRASSLRDQQPMGAGLVQSTSYR